MRNGPPPLVDDLGPGLPFQTRPDPPHPFRMLEPLALLVVHVIDVHRLALNPAAIDQDRLEQLHAHLHGWAALR